MIEDDADTSEPSSDAGDGAQRVMTTAELASGLEALKTRAFGLLADVEARNATAAEKEAAQVAAAIQESKEEELVPLEVPLDSRQAALNLGRMVARNERLFNRLLKDADTTSYRETFLELVLMAARTAQVTGSLVAVMHRIDGVTRHLVRHEQAGPAAAAGHDPAHD